jgi:hypothetical protein
MKQQQQPPPLCEEPGWIGAFTRNQVPGAIPNGQRIVKVTTEEGDSNPVGTEGAVLGSFNHPKVFGGAVMYFVEWNSTPRMAVAVVGRKIAEKKGSVQ